MVTIKATFERKELSKAGTMSKRIAESDGVDVITRSPRNGECSIEITYTPDNFIKAMRTYRMLAFKFGLGNVDIHDD